jgi:hypothetical protein
MRYRKRFATYSNYMDIDLLTTDKLNQNVLSRDDEANQQDEDWFDEDDAVIKEEYQGNSDGDGYEEGDNELDGSKDPVQIAAVFEQEVRFIRFHTSVS